MARKRFTAARIAAVIGMMLMAVPQPVAAETPRITLGWGRIFTNDGIGDTQDRWRSGAYTLSRVRGPDWTGDLPGFGQILELRLRTEIIAPANLKRPAPRDRRYAGLLSVGLHSHFDMAGFETSLGADLAIIGKQTGVGRMQDALHGILGATDPANALADQLPNAAHPTLVAEMGRSIAIGPATLRPFVEAQAGLETLVRAGGDLSFGGYGAEALMLREMTTGQRYRAVRGDLVAGYSLTLGGDVTRVFDSAFFPGGGVAPEETRSRLRAGFAWQNARGAAVFYGVTWLSEEFIGQPEPQTLGSLNVNLQF